MGVRDLLMIYIVLAIIALLVLILVLLSVFFFKPFKHTDRWNRPTHEDYADENEATSFMSRRSRLAAHIYGAENKKGTLIFSHGMGVPSDYYIPEARYFAKAGYRVILFDNTGYWKNKGIFFGFPRAAKDLAAAIRHFDNGTPLILLGHSMGAYAVCTTLPEAGENVKAVVAYSGFDNEPEIIKEFADTNLKICKGLVAFLLSASQFILFPHIFFRSSWKCLKECGCRAMIIHGSADEEISINGASLYAHAVNEKSDMTVTFSPDKEGYNTHMGVVRPVNEPGEINKEVLPKVLQFIDELADN